MISRAATVFILALFAATAQAQYNPARVTHEAPAVAQRFPDPDILYDTPGFRPGRDDFTSHAEMLAFLARLTTESPHARLDILGTSQRGLNLPLMLLTAGDRVDPQLPTVLVIGQQHGDEPAGGEAALVLARQLAGPRQAILTHVNVLIIPRGNPDGADQFRRATASGIDVNRDHLLLNTPEGRAIALAVDKYKPQVMLDLHEFTVAGRWVEKFGGVMKFDALLQPATVGNLDPGIAASAASDYIARIEATLTANGLTSFKYHTTAAGSPRDKTVSMGGVQADTGRNVGGLRPAISLLIEVRGVGIGRAHFLRRVHTQVLAATAAIELAAAQGPALIGLVEQAAMRTRRAACQGDIVVEAQLTETRERLTFLDAASGQDMPVEVDWRAASPLNVVRSRPRPCGYLFAGDQTVVIERLRQLGVEVHRVVREVSFEVERYVITHEDDGKRQDARGAIEDDAPIRKLEVRTERMSETIEAGTIYVPLDQPHAGLITVAFEPDSQNSFPANRLLDPERSQLRRVMQKPSGEAMERIR